MNYYSKSKKFDAVSFKNTEESEVRSETVDVLNCCLDSVSIKDIHNKAKEYK